MQGQTSDGVVVASRIQRPNSSGVKNTSKRAKREYVNTFQQRVTSAQRSRDQHVAELDALGPEIRNHLSAVLKTAKQDGDVTAGYLAGLAQQNLLSHGCTYQSFYSTIKHTTQNDLIKRSKSLGSTSIHYSPSFRTPPGEPWQKNPSLNFRAISAPQT